MKDNTRALLVRLNMLLTEIRKEDKKGEDLLSAYKEFLEIEKTIKKLIQPTTNHSPTKKPKKLDQTMSRTIRKIVREELKR